MATRIVWQAGADGAPDVFVEMPLPNPDAFAWEPDMVRGGDGASLMENAPQTRAQKRLFKLREGARFDSVRRVDVDGDNEPYWVKRGGFTDLVTAAALSGRNQAGVLSLSESEGLASLLAALLRTFVVAGENERAPFFVDLSEARGFVDDPSPLAVETVGTLYYAILDLNPEAFPEGAAQAKNVYRAIMEHRTASSTALSTTPETG